ncbi:hypothetical protein Pint_29115 [Pistacia integerrima]|uniref:Uncharacterized protein n=1 Tax=Pistacia integerrima TaxID=434235 RepID=A0ACC0X199_9ROSI|nr:hypothetical protein Pint_29115 [Pistacia integerrima]
MRLIFARLENQSANICSLQITLIDKAVLDKINQALSFPPTSLVATTDIIKMGPPIRATGNISPSVNGVIKWVTRPKIAQKCLQSNSRKYMQRSSHAKNQKWLVDSAASHNMTTDLSNLSINSEYDGTDEVVIGDGSGSDHGGDTTQRRM